MQYQIQKIPLPKREHQWTLYGSNSCIASKSAQSILSNLRQPYEFHDVREYGGAATVRDTLRSCTQGSPARATPYVFLGDVYIGGYDQICNYFGI